MASEDAVLEQPEQISEEQTGGPGPKPSSWIDNLSTYLTKKPSASDDELFKKFPELGKDSKRLDVAFSYIHAKSQGMTDEDAKKLYPDIVGPSQPYIDPKNKIDVSPDEPNVENPNIPKLDTKAMDKKLNGAAASESTASPGIKTQIEGQENEAKRQQKIQAKYKPMLDKVMSDIQENKDQFVENKRPALDYHPDAPDTYYEVPKVSAIDDYLKKTIPNSDDRYYLRNRIIQKFHDDKDAYTTQKIADQKIDELPAVQQATQELTAGHPAKPLSRDDVLKKAAEIDPTLKDKLPEIQRQAAITNENVKNETTRSILNNSTSLEYDENGNLKKVNPLDANIPFHDQITGASKALQGFFKFSGQVGQMASGVMKYFGAKESGYNLQKSADDFIEKNAFPGGTPTPTEYLAGEALPMVLQGEAMGRFARTLGAPAFKALAGASAKGLIGKFAEGALGGVALAPINSALISHDYYTQLVRSGEAPEIAHAKAERVFDKNLVTDMAISPLQFGIMNAPVNSAILKGALQYGVSPAIAGGHFMAQDFFQQKESNPALTAWKYATSSEGLKTGITGALTGLIQHYAIGKMNDWQNAKNVKDAFSFGRKDASPETAALPANNVIANTVLNAFEMKDSPRRADELKGLVGELHTKGVYNEAEANKITGIIDDVAAVKGQVPKMGDTGQRMAVFNELLNKKNYEAQLPAAGNPAVADLLQTKMKESDQRIQKIMNEEEPLYFINGIETSKEQLQKWADENPDLVQSKAVKIDIINDDETKQKLLDAKNQPAEQVVQKPGYTAEPTSQEIPAETTSHVTEVRHAITPEDERGVTSGPTDVKLNETGRAQAEDLAESMKDKGVQKVVSSGLPRAAETAQIVADKLGINHAIMPEIKSWDIGEFDQTKDTDFKKAEKYFVANPDATEFEGKKINESFNQYKDRVIDAREKIDQHAADHTLVVNHGGNINVWDAYQKNGKVWDSQASENYLKAADIPPAKVRKQEEMTQQAETQTPVLKDRTPEFSKFYDKFKDEIAIVPDSSFDFRWDSQIDQKTREGAIKDIRAGKETKRAKSFLDELQRQYDSGNIEYTRGRGNHVEKFGIPVEEWSKLQEQAEPEVVKDVETGLLPDDDLAKWLAEESKNWQPNEHDTDETGLTAGDHKTGASKDKLLQPVHKGNEDEAGGSKGSGKDESRPAAARSEKSLQQPDKEEGAQPLQKNSAKTVEESQAIHELAELLGRKISEPEIQKMDRLSANEVRVNGSPNSTEQYLSKAKAVLQQLFPDHSIRAYDTEAEYSQKEGRPSGSAGVYDPEGKYIAFNMERIRAAGAENTIFHEVIHPIVREALQSRPGAVDSAYSKLVEMRDEKGMGAIWAHEDLYRGRGVDTMKVEAITEFLTHVADGKIDPSKFVVSTRTKIVDAINKIFKALGIDKVFSTAQDIRRLADNIKQAFEKADATPIKEGLGKKTAAPLSGKMDALKPDEKDEQPLIEQYVREKINEYKESTLIKALTEAGRMKLEEAKELIDKVKAEQNMSPEEIIQQAMDMGKKKTAGAGQQIVAPLQAATMKPGLMKTMRRWYFDGVDEVSDVKSIIRKNNGKQEFDIDAAFHATRKLVSEWNGVPKVKQMAFILGVEKPELLTNQSQKVQDMAAAYRQRLDKTFETIRKYMPGLNYIEDYFPHFWEKPEQARNFFASTLAKSPMEGSKGFAKKRFFETIVAGLKEGYKLSTTNPEEMVRLAEANAWKFRTAHDIFQEMKDKGYLKYAMGKDKPEGWETVQDPLFNKIAATVDKNGNADLLRGAFYMPPDVAKLMTDYLSKGINGPVKTMVQQYNNIKNLFQLGVGFFHFGTTTTDAIVSGMTNAIQKISAGNPRGLVDLATFGNLPATVIRGFRARADWNAGKVTADTQALMDANARVGRQKMYSLDAKYNMMKAFGQLRADKDFSQLPKALWNGLLYLPESINKPLMEHWVPSLKVGGYLRSLDSEIQSRKNMSPAELQTAKQKIWDSMDDRLGQVVYDNIFVKKSLKDLAFLAIRSAGWTGGTIRAVSGGAAELPRSAQRLVRGQGLSQRTAYLVGLPLTVGLMGAFYQYLMTGQGPDEMKDYFFPKDGTKSPDGTDHRVDFPSYMKDILAYGKSPVQTLLHKTSPIINDAVEIYSNKDFYGEKVYNSDDPIYQKGLDVLKHEAGTLEPFSFKKNPYDESPFMDQVTTRPGLEQKFGIMPAPRERERSDVQNAISKAYGDQMGHDEEGKTHAQMEQIIARRHLREFIFNGGDYNDASQEWKDKAALTPQALGKFIHDSQMDPYERYFKQLKAPTKIKLYQQMSDEDKEKYGKWIPVSLREAANIPKTEEQ